MNFTHMERVTLRIIRLLIRFLGVILPNILLNTTYVHKLIMLIIRLESRLNGTRID